MRSPQKKPGWHDTLKYLRRVTNFEGKGYFNYIVSLDLLGFFPIYSGFEIMDCRLS